MKDRLQIGIPCVYEALCFWLGVGFAVAVVGSIGYVFYSIWKERNEVKKRREERRLKRQKRNSE